MDELMSLYKLMDGDNKFRVAYYDAGGSLGFCNMPTLGLGIHEPGGPETLRYWHVIHFGDHIASDIDLTPFGITVVECTSTAWPQVEWTVIP